MSTPALTGSTSPRKTPTGWPGSSAYWGVESDPLPLVRWTSPSPEPGVYVFPTHSLIRGRIYARRFGVATDWLSRFEPSARLGYHTWIYRFEERAE